MRHLEHDPLMSAAASALASSAAYGNLRASEPRSSDRGSSVDLVNDQVAISITADWLEGELGVSIRCVGGVPVDLADLADTSEVKGLSLSQLKRGISVDMLARRLTQVLDLLERSVPGLLDGTDVAVASLRARSA
jgi:hypothetical protein